MASRPNDEMHFVMPDLKCDATDFWMLRTKRIMGVLAAAAMNDRLGSFKPLGLALVIILEVEPVPTVLIDFVACCGEWEGERARQGVRPDRQGDTQHRRRHRHVCFKSSKVPVEIGPQALPQ